MNVHLCSHCTQLCCLLGHCKYRLTDFCSGHCWARLERDESGVHLEVSLKSNGCQWVEKVKTQYTCCSQRCWWHGSLASHGQVLCHVWGWGWKNHEGPLHLLSSSNHNGPLHPGALANTVTLQSQDSQITPENWIGSFFKNLFVFTLFLYDKPSNIQVTVSKRINTPEALSLDCQNIF